MSRVTEMRMQTNGHNGQSDMYVHSDTQFEGFTDTCSMSASKIEIHKPQPEVGLS